MALKDTYKEVEKENENKVKDNVVTMNVEDFVEEHKELIRLLREGTKKELMAEADSQEEELKECLEEHNMEEDDD